LRSLSQSRYVGARPYGVASRSCCATQGSVGDLVTPTWITRRDLGRVLKNAKSGRKKRSVTGKRVAGPDIGGVFAQKGCPSLSSRLWCANPSHVLLNGSLAHVNVQLKSIPADTLSTPQSILCRHLPDQGDSFCSYLRHMRSGLRSAFPDQAKELPMPPQQRLWLNE
jgi:hypothetical protein